MLDDRRSTGAGVVRAAGATGCGAVCPVLRDASGDGVDDVPVDVLCLVGAGSGFGVEGDPARVDALRGCDGYGSGLGPVAALACTAASAAVVRIAVRTTSKHLAEAARRPAGIRPRKMRRSRNVIFACTSSPARFVRSSSKLLPVVRQVNTEGRAAGPQSRRPSPFSFRYSIDSVTYLAMSLFD